MEYYFTVNNYISVQVEIVGLPPHTTHILQPLDVAIFAPVKAKVLQIARDATYLHRNNTISRTKLPQVLSMAMDQACTMALVKSSFKKCGIFPLDKKGIDWSQVKASNVDYVNPKKGPTPTTPADGSGSESEPETNDLCNDCKRKWPKGLARDDDVHWVTCDICDMWYHCVCVGCQAGAKHFMCHKCEEEDDD